MTQASNARLLGNRIGGGLSAPGGNADGIVTEDTTGLRVSGNQIGVNPPNPGGTRSAIGSARGIRITGNVGFDTIIGPTPQYDRPNTISGNGTGILVDGGADDVINRRNRITGRR